MDQNFNLIIKNNYYEVNIINSNLLYLYKKIKNKKIIDSVQSSISQNMKNITLRKFQPIMTLPISLKVKNPSKLRF